MNLRQAAQQALEALIPLANAANPNERECLTDEDHERAARAVEALEQALAEPEQEPVAWDYELATTVGEHGYEGWSRRLTQHKPNVPEGSIRNLTPLYTAPTPRKLEPYDQTALELCGVCGWKTLIPGDACLNCARQALAVPEQEPFMVVASECAERGCMAHDDRVDGPGVVLQSREKQEPVAWELRKGKTDRVLLEITNDPRRAADWRASLEEVVSLYTAPTPRKPLTDEELRKCFLATNTTEPLAEGWPGLERFARAIEEAIWKKNS